MHICTHFLSKEICNLVVVFFHCNCKEVPIFKAQVIINFFFLLMNLHYNNSFSIAAFRGN